LVQRVKHVKGEVIAVRCGEETKKMWLELLYEYKKMGLTAEDLLADALRLLRESGYPRAASVY